MAEEKKNPEVAEEIKEEAAAQEPEVKAEEKTEEAPADKKESKKESKKTAKEAKKAEKADKTPKEEEKPAEPMVSKNEYLRLAAEYDNYRKRTQKEKDDLYSVIKADTVAKFLPVYDDLERALSAETEDAAYRKGVEMIMGKLKDTMTKLGVTEIECLGKPFDPAEANAVMHVDDEEKGENEVVEVFQKGFKLEDRVIRFAMVKVAN